MTALSALSAAPARFERRAGRLLVVVFVALIAVNVAMRYGAGRPILFPEELAAILPVWLTFIAVSDSIHDRAQIGVTLLADALPARIRRLVEAAVRLLVAAMLALLLRAGLAWLRSPAVGFEQAITTGWAKWPFFTIFPIFRATALVHAAAHLAGSLRVLGGRRV